MAERKAYNNNDKSAAFLMAQVSHIKEAFRFFDNERISEMSKNIKEASMQQSA